MSAPDALDRLRLGTLGRGPQTVSQDDARAILDHIAAQDARLSVLTPCANKLCSAVGMHGGLCPGCNADHIAALTAREKRTLQDHGRMLWRDDVEAHCQSPDLCFEYGPVRCSPCAIKQADAAGVETLRPEQTFSPEECRLKREIADLTAERYAAVAEVAQIVAWLRTEQGKGSDAGCDYAEAFADQITAGAHKESGHVAED